MWLLSAKELSRQSTRRHKAVLETSFSVFSTHLEGFKCEETKEMRKEGHNFNSASLGFLLIMILLTVELAPINPMIISSHWYFLKEVCRSRLSLKSKGKYYKR